MPKRKVPKQQKHYLREWRDYIGLTQDQALGRLGWSQSKLSRLESHAQPLTLDSARALADAYGRTTFELVNVNPFKEGQVVDISERFKASTPDQQKQIITYIEFITKSGGQR